MRLRSPHDREILYLALPALGALAAEPLYVLADTAIVGHLGRPQIAALGLAGVVLAGAFTIFNFLTYGTTAVVARASGAGEEDRAARLAAQALWVSLAIGAVLLVVLEAVGEPLLRALGGHGERTWLRDCLEDDEQYEADRERYPQGLRSQSGRTLVLARTRRPRDDRGRPVGEEVEDREGPGENDAGEAERGDLRAAEVAHDRRVRKHVERLGGKRSEGRDGQAEDLPVVR